MAATLTAEDRATPEGATLRTLTLSNPRRKNALDAGVLDRIASEAARATADGVRAVLLAGEGGVFSSGYDLSALPAAPSSELPDAPLARACEAIEACAAPFVAVLEGPAFGGAVELAAACDARVAGTDAVVQVPPAKLGIVYSPDGIWRLARLVGLSGARRLLLGVERLDAAGALALGLVDEVSPDPRAAAITRAEGYARLAPLAVAGMKRALAELFRAPLDAGVRAALAELRAAAFASEDAREGLAAMQARRPPRFVGR